MDDLDPRECSTIDVSMLRVDHDTSQCGVSLLDVSNISFDSFLVSGGTCIPQFIFDSIGVMENGTPVTSWEPDSTCSNPSPESTDNQAMDRSLCISPSKQILDLLCATDVTQQDNQSDTDIGDSGHNTPDYQEKYTVELSDTNPSLPGDAESPGSVDTAYSEGSYDSSYIPVNNNLTGSYTTEYATQFYEYNSVQKEPSMPDQRPPHTVSIENAEQENDSLSFRTMETLSTRAASPPLIQDTLQEDSSPSFNTLETLSTRAASPLLIQDTLQEDISPSFNTIDVLSTRAASPLLIQDTLQEDISPSFNTMETLSTDASTVRFEEYISPSFNTINALSTRAVSPLLIQDTLQEDVSPSFGITDAVTRTSPSSLLHIPLVEHLPSVYSTDTRHDSGSHTLSRESTNLGQAPPQFINIDTRPSPIASSLYSETTVIESNPFIRSMGLSSAKETTAPLSYQGNSLPVFSEMDTHSAIYETTLLKRGTHQEERPFLKLSVGEASQLPSYLQSEPPPCTIVQSSTPRHVNIQPKTSHVSIQPKTSQMLIVKNIPPVYVGCSHDVPALSPTESESSETDLGMKRKGRTTYSMKQLRTLEKDFLENPYPDTEHIELLSSNLDLPVHRLRIWFQNKRARWRRRTKVNETSEHPVYQPPLPFSISSYPQPAPISIPPALHSDASNDSQTSLNHTSPIPELQHITSFSNNQITSAAMATHGMTSNGMTSHGMTSNVMTSHENFSTSLGPKAVPIIPTAVRYNSKLLTSAVLAQMNALPRGPGGAPVSCKVSPDSLSGFTSQPNRLFSSLQNTLPPRLSRVLTPSLNFHPNLPNTAPMSGTDSYKYLMYNVPKNPLEYSSSSSQGSHIFPMISTSFPSAFQPYFPHVQPVLSSHGARHVQPY